MAELEGLESLLTSQELDLFRAVLEESQKIKNRSKTPKQIRKIVPIREWIEDEYYVGPPGMSLYPYWKERIIEVFDENREVPVNELVVCGGIGCKPLWTRIPTSLGYLTYEELMEFDKKSIKYQVMSENGLQDTNGVLVKGEVPTKKVRFDDGSFTECTFDHRVRAIRNKEVVWVRYDELRIGDRVLKSRNISVYPEHDEDLDFAYFLGFFIGDGNCFSREDDKRRVRVSFGKTSIGEISEEIVSRFLYRISDVVNVYDGRRGDVVYRQYNVCNDWLRNKLKDCGHGAVNKHIPEFAYRFTFKETCELVAGLFDSDGSVELKDDKYVAIAYSCSSERLINQLQVLLANLGIVSRINSIRVETREDHSNQYRLRITDYLSIKRFGEIIPLKVSYKSDRIRKQHESKRSVNITDLREELVRVCRPLGLIKKLNLGNKMAGITKLNECKQDSRVTSEFLDYIYDRQCYEVEVVSVEEGFALCGDVSVRGSHTYFCDAQINHNTGKSTFGVFCVIRKIYELSCYVNIPALFQLMPGTLISFMYFTVSKTQAELTGYGQIKYIIDSIPYFKELFPRNDRLQSMLVFPENLLLFYGSTQGHVIGMNMIGSILDEANFFQNGAQNPTKSAVEYSKIQEMYTSIVNRTKSRFKSQKMDASLSMLISSNTTSSSFTDKRIKEVEGDDNVLIINARVWDVKPKGTYSDEMFWVFTGSDLLDPYVVQGIEDVYQYTDSIDLPRVEGSIDDIINTLVIGREKFVQVPIDFKKQYEDNLIMSLQDISGLSVAPSGRLFSSRPLYRDACDTIYEHPFYKQEITISTHDKIAVKDYLDPHYKPLRRNKKRFIHIDQSTTNDSTGFVSSYIDRYIRDPSTGLYLPVVVTDMLLRINPPKPPRKISISKVRDFVFFMRDVWQLEIGWVSYDQFQSSESLQTLSENGIPCGQLSVDRTDEQYLTLVNLFYEHRIQTYRYKPAENELFELIHYRNARRVDHPSEGCFTGDTKIKLLNGTDVPIKDLVGREDVELYGMSPSGGIVPTVAKRIWETKKTKEIYEVKLDNGEVIKCTGKHPFMMRDGSYVEVKDFLEGDSLMPLYNDYQGRLKGYERVYNPIQDRWRYTHALVDEFYNGKLPNGWVVHHYNINSKDNTRGNLERMTREDHGRRHALISKFSSNPEVVKRRVKNYKINTRLRAGVPINSELAPWELKRKSTNMTEEERISYYKDKNSSSLMRDSSREVARNLNKGYWKTEEGKVRRKELSKTQLAEARKVRMDKEDQDWLSRFDSSRDYKGITEIKTIYGGGSEAVKRSLFKIGFNIPVNHKVVSINKVILSEEVPVYDIEVPLTSNFALSAGVFVHNSKDVMDAWAGSVWNALIYSADEMPQANSETVPRFIHLDVEDDIFSVEELLGGVEL